MELEPLEGEEDADNFRVKIGDDVIVDNDEFDHQWVVHITQLFIDKGDRQVVRRDLENGEIGILFTGASSVQGTVVLPNRRHARNGDSQRQHYGTTPR